MTNSKNSITFDRAAGYYDATRGFPPGIDRKAAALIAHAASINRNSVVLEIGVGTGRLALPLAQHCGPYYGVDLSAEMMHGLNAKRPDYPGAEIRLVQADVMCLPVAAHCMDFAVLSNILHLIPQPHVALDELKRVLKPGGATICAWDRRREPTLQALTDAWEHATGDLMRFDSIDTGPKTLTEAGWTLRAQTVLEYSSETTAELKADVFRKRIYSSMWRLNDALWHDGVRAVEEALAQHFPDPHRIEPVERRFHVAIYTP